VDDSLRLPDVSAGSDLAARAASGDADAFEALVLAHQRRVYGFAYRYLRDPHEAADLAQEIFLRLFRKLDRFDTARPFEPWFWRLAARVSADYLQRVAPVRTELALDDCAPSSLAGTDAAPSEETALGSALARLPRSYRLPLLLHHELDLTLQEVAEVTHSTVSAVKSRLHRARLELQRELLEDRS
jgi:RNA polymerase sigma-70 factor, ECF subfamily